MTATLWGVTQCWSTIPQIFLPMLWLGCGRGRVTFDVDLYVTNLLKWHLSKPKILLAHVPSEKRWWVWSTKHCWKNIKEELSVVSSLRISSPQKHSHPVWLRLRNIINFTMICWIAMVTHTMPFASMHRLPSALEISPLGHLLSAKASRRLQSLLHTKPFEASKGGSACLCAFSVTKTVVQTWTIAWELHKALATHKQSPLNRLFGSGMTEQTRCPSEIMLLILSARARELWLLDMEQSYGEGPEFYF